MMGGGAGEADGALTYCDGGRLLRRTGRGRAAMGVGGAWEADRAWTCCDGGRLGRLAALLWKGLPAAREAGGASAWEVAAQAGQWGLDCRLICAAARWRCCDKTGCVGCDIERA